MMHWLKYSKLLPSALLPVKPWSNAATKPCSGSQLSYICANKISAKPLSRNQSSTVCATAISDRSLAFESSPGGEAPNYALRYRKGDELFGFVVQEITEVPELHLTAMRLRHSKTDADYLHIARNDTNNVFSVGFRTPPPDSAGVCHILEHLALCGSQVYPCRDPFFKMLSRSVSTFMNAFTGSDYTLYPFSSQNFHDFNNLMHVYLDAAFFPNLKKLDFNQEGWRLEHENLEDQTSPIVFKGVVFNEMKGAFSSSASHFMQNVQNKLLPDNAYGQVSGGHPLCIPSLSWEDLQKFHRRCYHPSNARFFSYGNFPVESHLTNVDNLVLSRFDKIPVHTSVPDHKIWTKPAEEQITCATDPMSTNQKQTTIAVSYLLDKITNSYDYFTLAVVSNLLVNGDNSPFYKSLIVPGIGSDFAPGMGFDGQIKQSLFSVGLAGISDADIEKVKSIIDQTLDEVVRDGFPKERIESVLHTIELGNKHQTSNFGLMLNMAINPSWNHGGNPVDSLKINDHMIWFRKQLATDKNFLQDKVKRYFQSNPHKLTLIMRPDEKFVAEMADKESTLLRSFVEKLTVEDKRQIYNDGLSLAKAQQKIEDVSCLPTLMIAEVDPLIQRTPFQETTIEGVPVFVVEEATNGIAYFRAISSATQLPEDLLPYLPLFANIVTRMGAGALDYMQQDQEASLCSGGLHSSIHLAEDPITANRLEQGILFSSFCLEKNAVRMFNLWRNIFEQVQFGDVNRIAQLVRMEACDLVQGIADHGHAYAMKHANSSLSAASSLRETFSGLIHVSQMQQLSDLDSMESVVDKLRKISAVLLNKHNLRCSLHTTAEFKPKGLYQLGELLKSVPNKSSNCQPGYNAVNFTATDNKSHYVMPFPVNFVAKSNQTAGYGHEDFAKLKVLSKLLSRKYLHREIREQGGAYGSGATVSSGGVWSFFSYRDPNLSRTLDTFANSIEWAVKGNFTPQDVDEAKLGSFSEIDQPIAPGDKGLAWFSNRVNDSQRQQYKDRLFGVQKEDLVLVAEKYLGDKKSGSEGYAVIGPQSEFTIKKNWKIVTK